MRNNQPDLWLLQVGRTASTETPSPTSSILNRTGVSLLCALVCGCRLGGVWHLLIFVRIRGQRCYVWKAVDEDGDLVDILDAPSGRKSRQTLLLDAPEEREGSSWQLVSDKLGRYGAAHRGLGRTAVRRTGRDENDRAEVSHQQRRREAERQMRRSKSAGQA